MELTLANRCPLNTTAASKLSERQYVVRTPFALHRRTSTVASAGGHELARIEWSAFGPDVLQLHLAGSGGGRRVRVSNFLRREKWWLHSRSFEHDGARYTWLDVPFRPLRLVPEGEKLPVAVLTQYPIGIGKTQLSVSTEGLVALDMDTIFVTAVIMLQMRRQRRHQRTSTARAVRL